MSNPFQKNFDYKQVIVEEISLEGLEGIGINLLWRRISKRLSSEITDKMKNRFWDFIIKLNCISIYQSPEPVKDIEILDRFNIIDEDSGDLKEPENFLDGSYSYHPVDGEYGSCMNYRKRVLLDKTELAEISYTYVLSQYGSTLLMVASIEERWFALAPHLPIHYLHGLTTVNYCILELIGRARENGQMTTGKTNITKIIKDSKLLFYNRKTLLDMDIIRVTRITHVTSDKGAVKSILLRLKKFHRSFINTIPKRGIIHNLVEYLKQQPNYCEKTDVILKKGLLTQKQNKRFQKKFYIFGFEENDVDINIITPTRKRPKPHSKRRYIYLCSHSDESSDSEEDDDEVPLKCQYKVGVNILRQAYELFLEAGLNGLTQVQVGQLLGSDFYVSRTICRLFKSKNIVREFLEDRGRQRTVRFIAVAATEKIDLEYSEEWDKFQKLLEYFKDVRDNKINPTDNTNEADPVPKKKRKLVQKEDVADDIDYLRELKSNEGLQTLKLNTPINDSARKITIRQLKFAIGVLRSIQDSNIIFGYQSLGKIVAERTNEPQMDMKAIKSFLLKLVADKYIKIFVIEWPGFKDKSSALICSPHIKRTDPAITAKYNEIMKKAAHSKESAEKKTTTVRPLTHYAFPRFMKIQKVHEAIVNYAYFDRVKNEFNDSPLGFIYIKDLILELTIEVALGNIGSGGSADIAKFTIDESLFKVKVCDAPSELSKAFSNSSHLCNSIRSTLKVLALFGLVQLIAQGSTNSNVPDNCLAVHLFYVNKHANLIDTTGVWPKANVPLQHLQRKFHFESFQDVKNYWSAVYNISTNTTIDVPNRNQLKPPNVPIRLYNEVQQYDNGQQYGNELGPCGFDSSFYLDIPRLWRAYSVRNNKHETRITPKSNVNIKKFDRSKRKIKRIIKPKQKPKKNLEETQISIKLPSISQTSVKKVLQKQAFINRKVKRSSHTTTWTKEEDRMVMMCKAAITIMSPISQPGSLQVRNLVAKDILSLVDPKKSQKVCHSRAAIVDCNSTMVYEKDCLLAELRRNHTNVIKKYEGTLKKLRILHSTNMSRYLHSARLPMLELVWILLQVSEHSCLQRSISGCIIDKDFQNNFTVIPSSSNKVSNSYKTPPGEVLIGPLKEAIILTVMLSFNNTIAKTDAEKIYRNFERYDERVLRLAVDDLRKCGAISAKEKILNGQMHKVNLDDIAQCWYKISVHYKRRWAIRLNSEFGEDLAKCIDKPIVDEYLKGSSELNCFCAELQAKNALDIVAITAPAITGSSGSIMQEAQLNTIDIETKYKLKSGTLGWRAKGNIQRFSDLYKDIDIETPLLDLARNSIVRKDSNDSMDIDLSKTENVIVKYLTKKGEKGATFKELKNIYGYENKYLIDILQSLEEKCIVKRVGVFENFIVLIHFISNWAMIISNNYILSKPWFGLDLKLRRDIFFKWASVLIVKIFEHPGCSLTYLSNSCDFISTASVQDICEVLLKYQCVTIQTVKINEIDLFSDNDNATTELADHNVYESPQNILVFPVTDSFVRYSFIMKMVLHTS